ncbi:unnamed protein product [Hapterophycus canaliculatus]
MDYFIMCAADMTTWGRRERTLPPLGIGSEETPVEGTGGCRNAAVLGKERYFRISGLRRTRLTLGFLISVWNFLCVTRFRGSVPSQPHSLVSGNGTTRSLSLDGADRADLAGPTDHGRFDSSFVRYTP